MNPSFGNYTIAMPWYEREDFYRLRSLADDGQQMTADYDVWRANATKVAQQYLAKGQALQIVTIRTDEFLEWLNSQNVPNTSASRLRYVEKLALTAAGIVDQPESLRPEWSNHSPKDQSASS